MRRVLAALPLLLPVPSAGAQALFPYCEAERLYVVHEAGEGFLLHGAAEDNNSIRTTITCQIVRFGTDVVAASSASCAGPACATATVAQTPYGGMSVCATAEYTYIEGGKLVGPRCTPIPAP